MGIRYFQVRMINRQVEAGETSHLSQINSLGIVFGFCSVLGITIVANFRSIQVSFYVDLFQLLFRLSELNYLKTFTMSDVLDFHVLP